MFLSQLVLDASSRQVQAELRDAYEMHRTLSKAFAPDALGTNEQRQAVRCLFRVDEDRPGPPVVLVQSKIRPEWDGLTISERYFAEPARVKEFDPEFTIGQVLSFRLRANPTVRRDGKRSGIYKEEERLSWLRRKSETSGFDLVSVVARDEKMPVYKRRHGAAEGQSSSAASFSAVQFDGMLRVNAPQLVCEAMENGIGSGKGFGFGLLSLARA